MHFLAQFGNVAKYIVKIEFKKVPTLLFDRGGEGVKSYLGHAHIRRPHFKKGLPFKRCNVVWLQIVVIRDNFSALAKKFQAVVLYKF